MSAQNDYLTNESFQQALQLLSIPCKADVDASLNSHSHALSPACSSELRTALSRTVPDLPPLPQKPPPSSSRQERGSASNKHSPPSSDQPSSSSTLFGVDLPHLFGDVLSVALLALICVAVWMMRGQKRDAKGKSPFKKKKH